MREEVEVKQAEPKKDYSTKKNASSKAKFKGVVVGSKGMIVGTKKPVHYKEGDTFQTDNESLYQDLINRKKIK